MVWKTGDFVLDILHEIEEGLEELSTKESKTEMLDDLIRDLRRMKSDLVEKEL